jgi:hypothetical protein
MNNNEYKKLFELMDAKLQEEALEEAFWLNRDEGYYYGVKVNTVDCVERYFDAGAHYCTLTAESYWNSSSSVCETMDETGCMTKSVMIGIVSNTVGRFE